MTDVELQANFDGMSDEEKLEAFADILLENIKLKKQIADLKAKK